MDFFLGGLDWRFEYVFFECVNMGRDIRIFIFIYIPIFITSIKSTRTPFHTKNSIPHENVLCPVTTRPPTNF